MTEIPMNITKEDLILVKGELATARASSLRSAEQLKAQSQYHVDMANGHAGGINLVDKLLAQLEMPTEPDEQEELEDNGRPADPA